MLSSLRKRLERDEDGFTLIELMVVVLIIAILLAIAIPTFLGARERANNRAAQSSLRNTVTAAKTIFTDSQDYTKATDTALTGVEPSISFKTQATASTTHKEVSVLGDSATVFYAAAKSASGKCFYIKDVTASGGGTSFAEAGSAATCDADAAKALASASWLTSWN